MNAALPDAPGLVEGLYLDLSRMQQEEEAEIAR